MLSKLTKVSARFPKTTIAIVLIITIFFAIQFPKMKIDTDPENMLEHSQPDRVFYDKRKTIIATMKDLYRPMFFTSITS